MQNYVEKCENLEEKLSKEGWQFIREMTQSVMIIPKLSEVKLDCLKIKKIATDVLRKYSIENEGCFNKELSDIVCRISGGKMIVLEDLPNLYDMEKFKTYEESREKDFKRYCLLTEIANRIISV